MIDPQIFRSALSRWGTGVSVITARDGQGRLGALTANSFTSVSLDPPLVLFCLAYDSAGFEVFDHATGFAVHVLAAGQEHLSNHFAAKGGDKFEGMAHQAGLHGAPLLPDCLAVLQCRLHDKVPAGDHLILLGEVEAVEEREDGPLMFYRGNYHTL